MKISCSPPPKPPNKGKSKVNYLEGFGLSSSWLFDFSALWEASVAPDHFGVRWPVFKTPGVEPDDVKVQEDDPVIPSPGRKDFS